MTDGGAQSPAADDGEHALARARLKVMDYMLSRWCESRELPPPSMFKSADPAVVPPSYERWAAESAANVAEVHRLAQQAELSDDELGRATALAEQALAAGMPFSVEEVRRRITNMAQDALATQRRFSDPRVRDKALLREFDTELSDAMAPDFDARLAAETAEAHVYANERLRAGIELARATWRANWGDAIAQVHGVAQHDGASSADVAQALGLAQQAFQALHQESTASFYRALKNKAFGDHYAEWEADPETVAEVASWPKPAVWARPLPNGRDQRAAEKNKDKGPRWHLFPGYPSASWWLRGALVADDEGAGLIDADGVRRPFPFSTGGCFLVRGQTSGAGRTTGDDYGPGMTSLFIAAPESYGKRTLLRLPANGFYRDYGRKGLDKEMEVESRLKSFAARAGMEFVERLYEETLPTTSMQAGPNPEFPGYFKAPSWEDAVYDQATKARRLTELPAGLRSLLGRRKPEWQDMLGR